MPNRDAVTAAVLAALRATGRPVGDGKVPLGHPEKGKFYAVLYSITGGRYDGPTFAAPEADAVFVYQVSSVGWRRDQAEQGHDVLRAAVMTAALAPAGWKVGMRATDGTPGGVDQEGDLFTAVERYRITVTPA